MSQGAHKRRVLVVDDSALIRRLLTDILAKDPALEVVGSAADPYVAREKILALRPDVLTLDVEMPRMDGLTFLRILMRDRPMPVVMVSSLTGRGVELTLQCLEAGAVDVVEKPKLDLARGLPALAPELVERVKAAACATVRKRTDEPAPPRAAPVPFGRGTYRLLAIGASTGGTEAIRQLLEALPADAPGVVITQHMPPGFTRSWAERCDRSCQIRVHEAQDGDRVVQGHALIAPGDRHLRVVRSGATWAVRLGDDAPVNRFRPSVDVMFRSVATAAGPNAVGVILTGMGADGAKGLLEMRQAGATTFAQDESTCVVFGMPREAIALGAAGEVLPLERMAAAALRAAA